MIFFGLPLHPLIVHAAVVLVPLAALGALAVVLSERVRTRFGWLAVAFAVAAAASAVAALVSGQALLEFFRGGSPAAAAHAAWGRLAPYPAIALAVSLTALMLFAKRGTRGKRTGFLVAAGLVIASALAGLTLITLTGHSGATAVWAPLVA